MTQTCAGILAFAPRPVVETITIPRPTCARPGDVFITYTVDERATREGGLPPECVFVVLEGSLKDGLTHAVELRSHAALGMVRVLPNKIDFWNFAGDVPSGLYLRSELKIVGHAVEYYPVGLMGRKLVSWDDYVSSHQDSDETRQSVNF